MEEKLTFRLGDISRDDLRAYCKAHDWNESQAIRAALQGEILNWILRTPTSELIKYYDKIE